MRTVIHVLFITILGIYFWGCQRGDEPSDLTDEQTEALRAAGDSLSGALLQTLKGELTRAIEDSGIVEAIRVCNTLALPLTDEISQTSEYAVSIKRTSLKYRNPQNAPDREEEAVLRYFEKLKAEDKPLPENYLQKVEKGGEVHYKYYKPIQTAGLCLNCHGDPQQMNPDVVRIIDDLYPEDKAKGYQGGDLRGAVSITFREF